MNLNQSQKPSPEAEFALASMRRGIEKATRQAVVYVEDLQAASARLRDASYEFAAQESESDLWRAFFQNDPVFALAFIRVEMERRLQERASEEGLPPTRAGVIDHLWSGRILPQAQAKAMADLLRLFNAAIHGATVDPKAADWALSDGLAIVGSLRAKVL